MSAGPVHVLPFPVLAPAAAPRTAEATVVAPGQRLDLLDAVRLVAAVGIVWVHAARSEAGLLLYPLGTFGVPFYTFVAVLFMARTLTKPGDRSLASYAGGRLVRVYVPFLVWSAVYVLLTEAKTYAATHHLHVPSPTLLYAGGHEHLWFLPYLLVVTLAGAGLVTLARRVPAVRWPAIGLLLATGAVFATLSEPAWVVTRLPEHDQGFWRFAFRALPTVFWSLALGLTVVAGRLPRASRRVAWGGLALVVLACVLQGTGEPFKVLRSVAGLGCVCVALLPVTAPWVARFGRLGRHSYGIYLSHLVFVRVAVAVMERYDVPPTFAADAATFVFAFAGAAVLSVLLSKSAWTRWTLGE